jgi:hypothetical protein
MFKFKSSKKYKFPFERFEKCIIGNTDKLLNLSLVEVFKSTSKKVENLLSLWTT